MKLIDFTQEPSLGSITGYITSLSEENFLTYLDEHCHLEVKEKVVNYLQQLLGNQEFTLLKNLYVEDEARNQGVGTKLMKMFLDRSHGPIVLICDNLESQQIGFNLKDWYLNNWSFQETGITTVSGPILIRE